MFDASAQLSYIFPAFIVVLSGGDEHRVSIAPSELSWLLSQNVKIHLRLREICGVKWDERKETTPRLKVRKRERGLSWPPNNVHPHIVEYPGLKLRSGWASYVPEFGHIAPQLKETLLATV